MTKVKISELTGAALDWAVAKCEGLTGMTLLRRAVVWDVDANMPH